MVTTSSLSVLVSMNLFQYTLDDCMGNIMLPFNMNMRTRWWEKGRKIINVENNIALAVARQTDRHTTITAAIKWRPRNGLIFNLLEILIPKRIIEKFQFALKTGHESSWSLYGVVAFVAGSVGFEVHWNIFGLLSQFVSSELCSPYFRPCFQVYII